MTTKPIYFMEYLRAVFRLLFFAIGTLFYCFRYLFKAFFAGQDLERALRLLSQWTRSLNRGIGLQVTVKGPLPNKPGLLVCNHRSYTDPFLIFGNLPAVPVGKVAIASWPVIGLASKLVGTVYVERANSTRRNVSRKAITDRLKKGFFVINFAEGTTHTKPHTLAFKPGLFKEAIIGDFPVYPVALDYQQTTDAWVGDDLFLRHFLATFRKRTTQAKISYGPALKAKDVQSLMDDTQKWIDQELTILRKDWVFE